MADNLRPDTREEIRTLCRKISVAHNLDAEIREELYGHMEDKLIAYLDGEETLAERDALILVREHFGNPSVVKGLLQDAHAYEADVSLARRLAAVAIVTAGVTVLCVCLVIAVRQLWPDAGGWARPVTQKAAIDVVSFLFPWLLLRHWQRHVNAGESPWFLTWRPAHFVGSMALLLVLLVLGTYLRYHVLAPVSREPLVGIWLYISMVIDVVPPVLQCMVWLWWCDRAPRRGRAVAAAGGLWAVWMWFSLLAAIPYVAPRLAPLMHTSELGAIAKAVPFSLCFFVMGAIATSVLYGMGRLTVAGYARWAEARR